MENNKTTIYLIRHSERFSEKKIIEYNTEQSNLIKQEKCILSPNGEKKAAYLATLEELQNIDKVYVSNCVRTLQTAKYLLENQNLPVHIDERLDEKRVGKPNDDIYSDWYIRQFEFEDFKTEGGESQKDVRERVNAVIEKILDENKGKRIIVFSHGYAITFYLMKYLDVKVSIDKKATMKYNGKIIFDKEFGAPEVFKLTFNDNTLIDIEHLEIDYSKMEA